MLKVLTAAIIAAAFLLGVASAHGARAATLATNAQIIDEGPQSSSSPYGLALAVDDQGNVLMEGTAQDSCSSSGCGYVSGQVGGILHPNGTFTQMPLAAGSTFVSPTDMNDNGLVIGSAVIGHVSYGAFWASSSGTAVTSMPGASAAACTEVTDGLGDVDDAGDAGGYVEGEDGVGTPCPITGGVSSGPGADVQPISDLNFVLGIQPDWLLVQTGGTANVERTDPSGGGGTAVPFLVPTAYSGGFWAGHALAPDGTVVGMSTATEDTGEPVAMLPDGTVDTLQMSVGTAGEADGINASDEIVGDLRNSEGQHAVIWTSPTAQPIDLNSMLPANSGWTLEQAFDISSDGWVLGDGTLNGTFEYFALNTGGIKVSGTVSDEQCGDATCSETGLAGVPIVLTGTTTGGSPASGSAITAADGTWSVYVPAGTYTAGPSQNDSTIDGDGFDPSTQQVTVGSTPVPNVNFSTCAGSDTPTTGGATASDRTTGSAEAPRTKAAHAGAAAASPDVSLCKSVYTMTLSAKIPQSFIVDPSPAAHYNRSTNPKEIEYDESEGWLRLLHTPEIIAHALRQSLDYPPCLSNAEVEVYTADHVRAEWYSYIKGGSLGSVTVPFVWNQSTQGVHVNAVPTETTATMTRVFKYKLELLDKDVEGSCEQTAQVPVLTIPLGGADDTGASMYSNQFTWITTWGFPFVPAAMKIDPESGILHHLLSEHCKPCLEWYENFEKLPASEKLPFEVLISYGLGTGEVAAIAKAPDVVKALFKAYKFLPGLVKGLEVLHELAHLRHHAASLHEAYEAYGILLGEVGKERYPLMSAVIRGQFRTNPLVTLPGNRNIPAGTTLAVSVGATRFPTISLSISRAAAKPTASSGSSTNTVFNGRLPWSTPGTNVAVSNPTFGSNPAGVVVDSATDGEAYQSGKIAVNNIRADTAVNNAVTAAIQQGALLKTPALFNAAQAAASPAACDKTNKPIGPNTICWTFTDQRP
jgi:hypothetical protein